MSSTVSVQKWCDNTDVHDMNAEPATQARTVLNEQGKPVLLDLCELCDSGVLAVYQLARFGSPVTAGNVKLKKSGQRPPSTAEREFPCPRCDYAATNKDGFGKHVRRQHGITTGEAMHEINGLIAKQSHVEGPLPQRTTGRVGRPPADAPTPWKCKVPRCGASSTSELGLYQHVKKKHNLYKNDYINRFGTPTPTEETG